MAEERIGFIGLGIMGQPMVANLIRAGFRPTVWNRSQPGIDACVALGAAARRVRARWRRRRTF